MLSVIYFVFSEFPRRFVWAGMWDRCTAEWCREQKDSWVEDRRWESGETLPVLRRRVCVWQGKLGLHYLWSRVQSCMRFSKGILHTWSMMMYMPSFYALVNWTQSADNGILSLFWNPPFKRVQWEIKTVLMCVCKICSKLGRKWSSYV